MKVPQLNKVDMRELLKLNVQLVKPKRFYFRFNLSMYIFKLFTWVCPVEVITERGVKDENSQT